MSLERKQIGETLEYKGHSITAHFVGPDLICKVDGAEMSGAFYLNANAAHKAGMRYVDQKLRETEKESAA